MFQLVEDGDTLSGIVNCDYPRKGKTPKRISFDVEFARPEDTELSELITAVRASDLKKVGVMLRELVVGWTGFKDKDGGAIEFDEENLQQLSKDTALAIATASAIFETVNGGGRAKNSKARLAGTRK